MDKKDLDLGTFEVKDEVVISDPCYEADGSCNKISKAKSGTWKAKIEIADEGDWGKRVADLFVCHKDYNFLDGDHYAWEQIADCGVDSGQLGVFSKEVFKNDEDKCLDNIKEADICQDEKFYNRMCYLTLGDTGGSGIYGGTFEKGVNVSSGFGDGCYLVRGIKKDGVLVAVWVNFIAEDEEDEDDYNDDYDEDEDEQDD